jgi:hypothetical protein
MTIFEVLLGSVNMTGWVISASSEMSAYGPLTPIATVMAPRSDASCWCISSDPASQISPWAGRTSSTGLVSAPSRLSVGSCLRGTMRLPSMASASVQAA